MMELQGLHLISQRHPDFTEMLFDKLHPLGLI